MRAKSLESQIFKNQIFKKLKKILKQHDVRIFHSQRSEICICYMHVHNDIDEYEFGKYYWPNLESMLFSAKAKKENVLSLHDWCKLVLKWQFPYVVVKNTQASGLLSCLADVSSLEEVLLKLDIMYPDV